MMKKIAIFGDKIDNYIKAYKKLGINLIIVDEKVNELDFDGLIIPGGVDVNPKYYGEQIDGSININNELDEKQFLIIDKFVKANKPILGICRGLQLLNVYFKGTLYQDIKQKDNHSVKDGKDNVHEISTVNDNILTKLYGNKFFVNSLHHQAIKDLPDCFDVLAVSNDGIIEAIKHKKLPIIAVQFHPERMNDEFYDKRISKGEEILKYFISML